MLSGRTSHTRVEMNVFFLPDWICRVGMVIWILSMRDALYYVGVAGVQCHQSWRFVVRHFQLYDTSPMLPNWPWAWPCWNCTTSYKFSVSVKKMGGGQTVGASDIVKAESSGEDPRATGGLRDLINLILIAFITGNSSLEPLIEGLCAQIHVNLRWRVFRPESNRGPYGLLTFLSAALSTTELWWQMNHRKSFRTLFATLFY